MTATARAPRRRRARAAAVTLALVALVGVSVLVARTVRRESAVRAAHPLVEGRLSVAGAGDALAILRDPRGVPHVEAASEADAFFGLGFVHAQDRLGQMFWLLRRAQGRVSEVQGPSGLAEDRLARTLDFAGLAEQQWKALDRASRAALEAYTRGVNARLARVRAGEAAVPVVLRDWEALPGEWRPVDSLAVLKLYSWALCGALDVDLVLLDLLRELGALAAGPFFPREEPQGFPAPPSPVTARRGGLVPDPLRRALGLEGRAAGSSAWVVGGAHTTSGLPLLAADSHLEPTAPSLLYLAHVRGGPLDVAGSTLPGVPVVWTGRNRHVAWAATSARAVTTDLYLETLEPHGAGRYHDGRRWRPLDERIETIRVRGGDDVELRVRSTRRGPLLEGLLEAPHDPLALAWVGARRAEARSLGSLLELAHAANADEVVAALAGHEEPPLAFVFADTQGSAGMQVAGWLPDRPERRFGTLPGRAPLYHWSGRVPFDLLPRARIGEDGRGWLVAADNAFPPLQGSRVEWLWRTGARAERLGALLSGLAREGDLDVRDMVAVQLDLTIARAHELVDDALSLASAGAALGVEAREVERLLRDWNGRADAGSVGAAAYHVFLGELTEALLEARLGETLMRRYLSLPQADPDQLVFEIVRNAAQRSGGAWSDPEQVAGAVREGLRETWLRLSFRLGANRSKWNWGRLHPLRFRAFAGSAPDAARSALGPFAYGGSGSTLAAAEYDPADPFRVRLVSGYRLVVDVGELDAALTSLAPGQSEHPGHRHFRDGLDDWLEGRPVLFATSRLLVEESSVARLELVPAP